MTAEKASAKAGSVLASLVAETMTDKKDANRQLTPVPGEAGAPSLVRVPDVPGDFLTDEGLATVEKDCRRHAAYLLTVADGIAVMRGQQPEATEKPVDLDAVRKEKEKAADIRVAEKVLAAGVLAKVVTPEPTEFEADLAAKSAAAQAATFKVTPESVAAQDAMEASVLGIEIEWFCPEHPDVKPVEKTSSAGRPYIGCPDPCRKFKR